MNYKILITAVLILSMLQACLPAEAAWPPEEVCLGDSAKTYGIMGATPIPITAKSNTIGKDIEVGRISFENGLIMIGSGKNPLKAVNTDPLDNGDAIDITITMGTKEQPNMASVVIEGFACGKHFYFNTQPSGSDAKIG